MADSGHSLLPDGLADALGIENDAEAEAEGGADEEDTKLGIPKRTLIVLAGHQVGPPGILLAVLLWWYQQRRNRSSTALA